MKHTSLIYPLLVSGNFTDQELSLSEEPNLCLSTCSSQAWVTSVGEESGVTDQELSLSEEPNLCLSTCSTQAWVTSAGEESGVTGNAERYSNM
ncbi:hypothetical protein E2C01_017406 [Portunus trituberculatus]|uniref:Uncharacterized protein n=1 Tax=Portunus trituberculatus TaxID=210409 RepID=A0A5B7DTA2_PORTR|nr:hypothetical protein [Portunus trituberculatus]